MKLPMFKIRKHFDKAYNSADEAFGPFLSACLTSNRVEGQAAPPECILMYRFGSGRYVFRYKIAARARKRNLHYEIFIEVDRITASSLFLLSIPNSYAILTACNKHFTGGPLLFLAALMLIFDIYIVTYLFRGAQTVMTEVTRFYP